MLEAAQARRARAKGFVGQPASAIDSGLPSVVHPPGLVFANGGDEHGVLG